MNVYIYIYIHIYIYIYIMVQGAFAAVQRVRHRQSGELAALKAPRAARGYLSLSLSLSLYIYIYMYVHTSML